VLVTRKDAAQSLDRPLARTLTPKKQVLGETLGDGAQVDPPPLPRLYTYDYQIAPRRRHGDPRADGGDQRRVTQAAVSG
jgi:hypothetical protein